ncbi:hypothetical protein ACMFMG_005115 [Clarireedia jacksonii]
MSKRIAFTVSGEVQGVSFRYFAKKKAEGYGLVGWVRNTDDEKVTGEVQGPTSEISKFVDDLNQGPSAAKVTGVEQKELDVKGEGKAEGGFNVVK